ncbi:MAG: hypothetical protein ACRDTT_22875 [Pseudonocardiaceae bacterium]
MILVWILLGAVGGFYLGRVWAENARATHDMKRMWASRRAYRKKR